MQTYWYKLPDSASCQGSSQSPVDIVQAIYKPRLTGPSFTASNGGCTVHINTPHILVSIEQLQCIFLHPLCNLYMCY
ncbi:hypothetical protein EON64_03730 [archaeon]|nr:MAG: hypothetical protein EON64_03730 [archaeon]